MCFSPLGWLKNRSAFFSFPHRQVDFTRKFHILQSLNIPFTRQDEAQSVYFLSLFFILEKLSKIDGIVTRGKTEVAERLMGQINLSGEEFTILL